MTTDVAKVNTVFNIEKDKLPIGRKLSGINWLSSSNSIDESRIIALRYIVKLILLNLTGFKLWLLLGHLSFQPDNRITRYRKL